MWADRVSNQELWLLSHKSYRLRRPLSDGRCAVCRTIFDGDLSFSDLLRIHSSLITFIRN